MGTVWFECEIDNPEVLTDLLEADSQPRRLNITDGFILGNPTEFEIACVEQADDNPRLLALGIDCLLPREISRFPKWLRDDVRKAWQLCAEHPTVEIRVVGEKQLDIKSVEQHLEELSNWLFRKGETDE